MISGLGTSSRLIVDYTYVSNDSDCKCTVLSCSFKRYRTTETDESIYRLLLLLCKSKDNEYLIKKPLYQVEETLNTDFVRISKTTIVNLKKISRVAPSLRGMMFIELKNGLKDNISRKYLPDFKNALDI